MAWIRNSSETTRKNQAVDFCALVMPTSPGCRNFRAVVSLPFHPSLLLQRPKIANRMPSPPSRATREMADHTRMSAVGWLSTRGSAGQLLVYE